MSILRSLLSKHLPCLTAAGNILSKPTAQISPQLTHPFFVSKREQDSITKPLKMHRFLWVQAHPRVGESWNRIPSSWSSTVALIAGWFFFSSAASQGEDHLSEQQLAELMNIFSISAQEVSDNQEGISSLVLAKAYEACKGEKWEQIDQARLLLPKLRNKQGFTLLTLAIEKGDEEIASKLLQRRIGWNKKDKEGNTPLHLAARTSAPSLNRLLLGYFSPNDRNLQGETPLHVAIHYGQQEALGVLLKEANLNRQSKKEGNFFHWAIHCGQPRMIDYLLTQYFGQMRALIEGLDAEGRTPLALAAYLGEVDAIYILKMHGANIEATDPQKRRPMHWACIGLQPEAVSYLIFYGADTAPHDAQSKTPELVLGSSHREKASHIKQLISPHNLKQPAPPPLEFLPHNLVFQGGGPKGIAHIAAVEELEKKKMLDQIERVAGASAGAIIATLIAVGYTSEDLYRELMPPDGQDLTKWLDYPAELEDEIDEIRDWLKEAAPRIKKKGLSIGDFVKALGTLLYKKWTLSPAKKDALAEAWKVGGICEGDAFLNWIEAQLKKATGIDQCTFGELAEFIQDNRPLPNGKKAKHLHLVATKLDPRLKSVPIPMRFSSEPPIREGIDLDCGNIVISHAVRMSISIPLAYKPHPIYKKDKKGKVDPVDNEGYFIDGGISDNFPLETFDYQRYRTVLPPDEKPENTWTNRFTWGFSLYSPSGQQQVELPTAPPSVIDVIKEWGLLLWNAEMAIKEAEPCNRNRMIRIDNQGIGPLDFDLKPFKKQELLAAGREETRMFIRERYTQKIGRLENYYDRELFLRSKAEGTLFLPLPHLDFLGREKELQWLKMQSLNKKWQEEALIVPIIAHSGYGKSELAIAFGCSHLKDFSYIWQIDLRNKETFERSYRALAHALGIRENRSASIEELSVEINKQLETRAQEKPYLLIFDNADDKIPVPFPKKGGCILITTQSERYATPDALRLSPLSSEDAIQLMKKIVGTKEMEIEDLTRTLRCIPLLVNQAAHYIANTPGCSVAAYHHALLKSKLVQKKSATDREIFTACWEISSVYLKDRLPAVGEWLNVCAYLNNQGIPKEWLMHWLAKRDGSVPDKSHYAQQVNILDFLTKYGLVYSHPYNETFSIHGLLQEIILETQTPEQARSLEQLISFLVQLNEIGGYNPTHPLALEPFKRALPHCVSVINHLKHSPSIMKAPLLLTMVRYLLETERNLTQAENYLKDADASTSGLQHPIRGRVLFFYGFLNKKKAHDENDPIKKKNLYQDALDSFAKAREMFSKCSNLQDYERLEQNPNKCSQAYQKAIALMYQGEVYVDLGVFDKAKSTLDEALKEYIALYSSGEHFDIARITREEGRMLLKQGKVVEAEKQFREVMVMQKKVYLNFDSEKTVAITYQLLGEVLEKQGLLQKADAMYEEAIEVNKRAYNTQFPYYNIKFYESRASLADQLEDKEKSKDMRDKAAEIRQHLALWRDL